MRCRAVRCHAVLCRAVPCGAVPCCSVVMCHAVPCRAVPCCAMRCRAMLQRRDVSGCARLCRATPCLAVRHATWWSCGSGQHDAVAWHGTAWHSTASPRTTLQRGAAWHGTAQRRFSTARHRSTQPSCRAEATWKLAKLVKLILTSGLRRAVPRRSVPRCQNERFVNSCAVCPAFSENRGEGEGRRRVRMPTPQSRGTSAVCVNDGRRHARRGRVAEVPATVQARRRPAAGTSGRQSPQTPDTPDLTRPTPDAWHAAQRPTLDAPDSRRP